MALKLKLILSSTSQTVVFYLDLKNKPLHFIHACTNGMWHLNFRTEYFSLKSKAKKLLLSTPASYKCLDRMIFGCLVGELRSWRDAKRSNGIRNKFDLFVQLNNGQVRVKRFPVDPTGSNPVIRQKQIVAFYPLKTSWSSVNILVP